jgi:hypothetical protein
MIPVGLLNAGGVFSPGAFNNTTLATSAEWFGLANSGQTIVASGRATPNSAINRSTNGGSTWASITASTSKVLGNIAYGNSRYVVSHLGNAAGGSSNLIGYSTNDGATFTETAGAASGSVMSVIHDGTRFIGYHYTNTTTRAITYSTDAVTWTQSSNLSSNYGNQIKVAQSGTTYVLVPIRNATTTGAICTSDPTVAANWSSMTAPNNNLDYVITGNSLFLVGVGDSATYWTSANGSTWTSRTLPATPTGYIGFANEYFWFKAVTTNVVYYSLDGINWTSTGLNTAQPGKSLAWNGNGSTLIQVGQTTGGSATNLGSFSS